MLNGDDRAGKSLPESHGLVRHILPASGERDVLNERDEGLL